MTKPTVSVKTTIETDPVPHSGNAADNTTVWIYLTDTSLSLVFGTDKACGIGFCGLDGKTIVNNRKELSGIPAKTPQSDAMSKDLSKRGFKFVGSTICYAFMQAAGLVNDHLTTCFRYRI